MNTRMYQTIDIIWMFYTKINVFTVTIAKNS